MSEKYQEGDKRTITQICRRRECEICGEPAEYRITLLLPMARNNPQSKAYGRDDCSWCADDEVFVCEEHKTQYRKLAKERGMGWCATFPASKFLHMFLFWQTIKEEREVEKQNPLCIKCGNDAQPDTDPPMCAECMALQAGEPPVGARVQTQEKEE